MLKLLLESKLFMLLFLKSRDVLYLISKHNVIYVQRWFFFSPCSVLQFFAKNNIPSLQISKFYEQLTMQMWNIVVYKRILWISNFLFSLSQLPHYHMKVFVDVEW